MLRASATALSLALLAAACSTTTAPPAPARPAPDADSQLLGGPSSRGGGELLGGPSSDDGASAAPARTARASASAGPSGGGPRSSTARAEPTEEYTEDEVVTAVSDWLGVSAETAGSLVEKVFADLGQPNAYIAGGEGSGAIGVGLRYGEGTLVTKTGEQRKVFWQGPSAGFDVGGNASKTFVLVYNLPGPDDIYRRFPGVEGSLYFVGGVAVNYQRADEMTLAPMRVGVGWRQGVNVGYLSYSRQRNILPF